MDSPFYIGTLNIYDYQALGYRRWNTWLAADVTVVDVLLF